MLEICRVFKMYTSVPPILFPYWAVWLVSDVIIAKSCKRQFKKWSIHSNGTIIWKKLSKIRQIILPYSAEFLCSSSSAESSCHTPKTTFSGPEHIIIMSRPWSRHSNQFGVPFHRCHWRIHTKFGRYLSVLVLFSYHLIEGYRFQFWVKLEHKVNIENVTHEKIRPIYGLFGSFWTKSFKWCWSC